MQSKQLEKEKVYKVAWKYRAVPARNYPHREVEAHYRVHGNHQGRGQPGEQQVSHFIAMLVHRRNNMTVDTVLLRDGYGKCPPLNINVHPRKVPGGLAPRFRTREAGCCGSASLRHVSTVPILRVMVSNNP
jgi:hypothetical protein